MFEPADSKIMDSEGFYYRLDYCKSPIVLAKQIAEDGRRRYKGFENFDEVTNFVRENKHLSLHEVTRCGDDGGGPQRLFLDVDAEQKDFGHIPPNIMDQACELLISSAKEVMRHGGADSDHIELSSHRTGKFSKHIVFADAYIDVNHYECFYKELVNIFRFNLNGEHMPEELIGIIDAKVYEKRHCLRIHTSAKFGSNVRLMKSGDGNEKFDVETLVTYIPRDQSKMQIYTCPNDCKTSVQREPTAGSNNLKMAEQILDSMSDDGISVAIMGNPFIRLNVDHSKPCVVCGSKHDSENVMAVVDDKHLKLICRRKQKGDKNRCKIIHTFKPYIEDVPTPIEKAKIQIIKTESDFLDDVDDVMSKYNRLFSKSDMGTAKSTRVHEYAARQIKLNPDFCCVFLTYRVNLAAAIVASANKANPGLTNPFEKYDEIIAHKISLDGHKKLIIQLESLNRIEYDLANNKKIDLVIIDEAVSFCQQSLAGLNKKVNSINQMMLRNLIKNSEKTIIMDALLDIPTIEAYQCLLPQDEQILWINEVVNKWAPNIEEFKDDVKWRKQLSDDLASGKKIYVPTTNGEFQIKKLERYLLTRKPDLKILTIYGGENNQEIIRNVNKEFIKYDCVIASPCMSAGVSFDVKDYFDAVYAFIDNRGPTAIDIIQSLRRIRHTKSNTLVLCNLSGKIQLPTTYKDIFDSEQERLKFNSWDYINDGFSLEINKDKMYFTDPDSAGLKWKMHCKRIVNLNRIDKYKTVIDYLKSKGGVIIKTVEKENAKQDRKEFSIIGADVKKEITIRVAKAPKPSQDEYDALKSNGKKFTRINHEPSIGVTFSDSDLMEKFQLLRHYGLSDDMFAGDDKQARIDPFSKPEFVEKYMKDDVKECYRNMIYRDLTNEQVKQIDDENTKDMNDEEKTDHYYLFGRHVTINKIKDLFKSGECDSKTLINYIAEIHKMKNPLLKGVKEIKENTVLNATNKLLSAYGYKLETKRLGRGANKKRIYIWKDYSVDLFVIKTLPFNSDEFTISAVRQSGNSEMPVAIVYEK